MQISDTYARVPCKDIQIKREERQRKVIDTSGIKDSIAKRGVLQPIIISKDFVLMAGERRLTASMELGLPDIPCRFFEELSPLEAQIVELEENVRRSDLSWQDQVGAISKLHEIYCASEPDWPAIRTAEALGFTGSYISRVLRVAQDLSNPRISTLTSMETAHNLLKRADERRAGDALSGLLAVSHTIGKKEPAVDQEQLPINPSPGVEGLSPSPLPQSLPSLPPAPIRHSDFALWAESYVGDPFNFIHCDFPYGVNVFDGQYGDAAGQKHYSDKPEDYFALIAELGKYLDRICSYSAHLMFWFSMEHYEATFSAFQTHLPDVVWQKFPLIWVKSDNVGIMPDPKRGPRRVYETCLIGTRGDRPVVKPVANAYSCPTDKQHHPSTKPEPMLRHFMQMFVDNGTRLLDPTCGGASALRAAETLGAESVLGLERDEEHYLNAKKAFETFRKLRKL